MTDRNERDDLRGRDEEHEEHERKEREKIHERAEAASRGGNPPRTTTGDITAPKFGSAGSGGAELEPGPERD